MNNKLIQQLQETDLFAGPSSDDLNQRRDNRFPALKGMTLGTPVKIVVEGERYSRYGEDSPRFKKTLTGSLKAVIVRIVYGCKVSDLALDPDDWLDRGITAEDLKDTAPAGRFVSTVIKSLEDNNGDGCDYLWLVKMVAPKTIVLFTDDVPDEDEEED